MRRLRIAIAQINTTVGDFEGNRCKILKNIEASRSLGVDLIIFPELAICGYPPEDLLFKQQFLKENRNSLEKVVAASSGITIVVGFVDGKKDIYNAAAIINDGKLVGVYHKIFLPNYGVFDENRYFLAGDDCPVYIIGGIGVGINICEDIWYEEGPTTTQVYSGAEVIVNISASPYHFGKGSLRQKMLAKRASESKAILVFNNLVGGQDELVFDGNSIVIDEKGRVIARGKQFEEELVVADLNIDSVSRTRLQDPMWQKRMSLSEKQQWKKTKLVLSDVLPSSPKPPLPKKEQKVRGFIEEIYDALVLGAHDYIIKNGFKKVVIGLSGGIDSSLVATIATDALGSSNVMGVSMPSRYSSRRCISDTKALAQNLDIRLITIPIERVFKAYLDILDDSFKNVESDVTEENLQARIRGNILMALSNKFGWLVLTTGNKSEFATGYTTLYGDMAGGFAVIKDVPKTMVYELAIYRNSLSGDDLIPSGTIENPPSAELRFEQKDTDTLPPYEMLDPILTAYVEEDKSVEQIVTSGFEENTVRRTVRLVDSSEYKRRQAPPGIKITPRAFGRDRRLPITNRFKG